MPYVRRETNMKKIFWWVLVAALVFGAWWAVWRDEGSPSRGGEENVVFMRGDIVADGWLCMDDSIYLVYHLFRDGRPLDCPDAADVNDDGRIDTTDIIHGLQAVFSNRPIPPPYCIFCGGDPTEDDLPPCEYLPTYEN